MTERFAEDPSRISAEGELVLAYLAGDDDAFRVLYERYHPDVLRLVKASVRDAALAEDIAQEAMASALRSLGGFYVSRPFWPWVRKIADHTVVAALAARAARSAEVLVEHVAHDARVKPDDADLFVTREMVAACLAALPPRQRRALSLRYLEGWSTDDIAALFGMKRNAIEQLLNRARARFRLEFRARDTGIVPVFSGLLARLRRVLTAVDPRVQGPLSSPYSVAGDLALGVALTFGVSLMMLGSPPRGPAAAAPPPPRAGQEQPPEVGGVPGRTDGYLPARAADTAGDPATYTGGVAPPWPDQVGARRRAVRAGAPRPVPSSDGGPVATDPHAPDGSGTEPGPGRPAPQPSPEPAPTPAPTPDVDRAPDPGIAEPPWIAGPTEEPSVAPALIDGVESVPSASSEVTVEDDDVEEGTFSEKHRVETELMGEPIGVGGGVSRSGDGSYSCDKLGVCLPVP